MKRRVLFVDDEPMVLDGLRRMLHSLRSEWDMEFAVGGQEALNMLAKAPFDVVVSDMRMPGMDGEELLTKVKKEYPDIVRIVLSGQADQETVMKTVTIAHRYLLKPCDSDTLKATITRCFALREMLADQSLKSVISQIHTLPSVPSLYLKLVDALKSPDAPITKIGEIISKDLSMTAKVLQLVNSAFFSIRRYISSPSEAVVFLGLDTIKALTLSIQVFSKFDQAKLPTFSIQTLWEHSIATGSLARRIARSENLTQKMVGDTLMAGLIHDVGKLVLAENLSEQYGKAIKLVREQKMSETDAGREVFGSTHTEVGAYLLSLWGLPEHIVEAVAFHHSPERSGVSAFGPVMAVHVADALEYERSEAADHVKGHEIDLACLAKIHLEGKVPEWRQMLSRVDEASE